MPEKHDPDERPDPEPTDDDRVLNWRLETCLHLAVSLKAAEKFAASAGDLERLRTLIAGGCPPDVAARIA